jgi:predicted nuclease of predicted toxin-antitoxin system
LGKPRLYLNEDIHADLAVALRKRGFDVVHTQEIDMKGSADIEQMAWAVQEQCCLFSHNIRDFVLLHNYFMKNNLSHFGIIVSGQKPIKKTLSNILNLLQNSSQEKLKNQVIFL